MTTPAFYRPNAPATVTVDTGRTRRVERLRADGRGRLRLAVPLGDSAPLVSANLPGLNLALGSTGALHAARVTVLGHGAGGAAPRGR